MEWRFGLLCCVHVRADDAGLLPQTCYVHLEDVDARWTAGAVKAAIAKEAQAGRAKTKDAKEVAPFAMADTGALRLMGTAFDDDDVVGDTVVAHEVWERGGDGDDGPFIAQVLGFHLDTDAKVC